MAALSCRRAAREAGLTERPELGRVLEVASELAAEYLHDLPRRHVGPQADSEAVKAALGRRLADEVVDAERVREMAAAVEPGLVASAGPRYFGFVFGGALPASVGADWLASAWDQNAVLHAASSAAAGAEQMAGEWLLDLLGLPADASFGLTGGAGPATSWRWPPRATPCSSGSAGAVQAHGLFGAPEVRVIIGDHTHVTLDTALQYLGLGRERVVRVPTDAQGQMRADAFAEISAGSDGPTIVCTQAGNVNTGACDPLVTPAGGGDADRHTRAVIRRVQDEGAAWLGGTTWHSVVAMRISVSNWSTTEADADATVAAILRAHGTEASA